MPQHDRQGIAQRALDHFEIGVAQPGGAHPHQHVGRLQLRRADRSIDAASAGMQHRGTILQGHSSRLARKCHERLVDIS